MYHGGRDAHDVRISGGYRVLERNPIPNHCFLHPPVTLHRVIMVVDTFSSPHGPSRLDNNVHAVTLGAVRTDNTITARRYTLLGRSDFVTCAAAADDDVVVKVARGPTQSYMFIAPRFLVVRRECYDTVRPIVLYGSEYLVNPYPGKNRKTAFCRRENYKREFQRRKNF